MKNKVYDAVIVAGGEYPTAPQPLEALQSAPFVVCCDGAADSYIATGGVPDAIVGDGDSISAANREKYAHLLHVISEQETNDQTKAVRFLMERGKRRIAIVGATGRREDHTIGNISLLIEYARAGSDVCSFTDHGMFIPCNGTTTHKCRKGQQVSIFSITAKDLSAKGLLYPIYDFNNWWQGTL
ncbi:MAG: thiamine diphosphokinase, partial [Bacteroidaceae bacterium]|nr:thiamine diphosphokinase [Bacteroidaceae bacterium]